MNWNTSELDDDSLYDSLPEPIVTPPHGKMRASDESNSTPPNVNYVEPESNAVEYHLSSMPRDMPPPSPSYGLPQPSADAITKSLLASPRGGFPNSPVVAPQNGLKYTKAEMLSFEASLDLYRKNAKKSNDPHAQLEFAKYLIQIAESIPTDPQVYQDDKEALINAKNAHESLLKEGMKWVKRLASSGVGLGKPANAEAQFFLAECYGNGIFGLKINHSRAFDLYVQASKQNHAAATFKAAVCYELGAGPRKDMARALQFFRKAAALGDAGAMYKLAMILLNGGMGVQRNEREGVTWLKRAVDSDVESNLPEALHELAALYEKGGVPSIITEEAYAFDLYSRAASLGYPPSQFKIGFCFEYGLMGCEVDPRISIEWYSRSAEKGHAEAQLALSGWYLTGAPGIIHQSDTDAYHWARKSAEQGNTKAEYAIGYYSEVGVGVEPNLNEALKWYSRAAEKGNQRATQRLLDIKKYNKLQRGIKPERTSENSDCVIM